MSAGDFPYDDTHGSSNFPVASDSYYHNDQNQYYYHPQHQHQHHHQHDGTVPKSSSSSMVVGGSFYPDNTTTATTTSEQLQDASEIVHEMYLALLYLLSNPDEFKKTLHAHPPRGATTLDEWNAELEDDYDAEEEEEEESVVPTGSNSTTSTSSASATPLPFVVFADDAEIVLPQAHTASQLFGIEKIEGIELEAAAGFPALSQLFLRWLGE
jgi:hypothetical protein